MDTGDICCHYWQHILVVNWTLGNKLQWNLNRNSHIFIKENAFENVVWKTAAILSHPQCVKARYRPLYYQVKADTEMSLLCKIQGCRAPWKIFEFIITDEIPTSNLHIFTGPSTLIARFMGPTWGPSGANRTQLGPIWPHELCYLGRYLPGHMILLAPKYELLVAIFQNLLYEQPGYGFVFGLLKLLHVKSLPNLVSHFLTIWSGIFYMLQNLCRRK